MSTLKGSYRRGFDDLVCSVGNSRPERFRDGTCIEYVDFNLPVETQGRGRQAGAPSGSTPVVSRVLGPPPASTR